MNNATFEQLVDERLANVKATLFTKAGEYAAKTDRLHNFVHSAHLIRGTKAQAAWAFAVKHLTSIKDMVDGVHPISSVKLAEKFGDAIAYMLLIEACLVEDNLMVTLPANTGDKSYFGKVAEKLDEQEEKRHPMWYVNCYPKRIHAYSDESVAFAYISEEAANSGLEGITELVERRVVYAPDQHTAALKAIRAMKDSL